MVKRHLASVFVVGVLVVVGVVAVVDAARSRDVVDRPAGPPESSAQGDTADSPTATLEAEGIRGVLYYSDREDDCRLRAMWLPALDQTSPPKVRACRFELPPEPGTGAVDSGAAWQSGGRLAATCIEGRVEVSTRLGAPVEELEGCAPAWKPDESLTLIREGEVWNAPCPRPEVAAALDCGRRLLSTSELTKAAHAVAFVPDGPRFLRSVTAIRIAWFSETRSALLVRVRLRGRFRALGPVTVLAIYEGERLLKAAQYAGAFDLRMSPRRSFVGVIEAGQRIAILNRSGRELLGAADLPSPTAHALAWSPNERWVAVATRWSVYLLPTSDLEAGRQPRIIRLPLAVGDLAWR